MAGHSEATRHAPKRARRSLRLHDTDDPHGPFAFDVADRVQKTWSAQAGRSSTQYLPNNVVPDEWNNEVEQLSTQPFSFDSGAPLKFACPFYKRSPHSPLSKSCAGPGWNTIHRVKEHICRNHTSRNICICCGADFAKGEDLKAHEQNASCKRSSYATHLITEEQAAALRSKKRIRESTEAGKWRNIYRILFPSDDPEQIPTPFHDMGLDQYGHLNNFVSFLGLKLSRRLLRMSKKGSSFTEKSLMATIQEIYDLYMRELPTCRRQNSSATGISEAHIQMRAHQESYVGPAESFEPVNWNVSLRQSVQHFDGPTPALSPGDSFLNSDGASIQFSGDVRSFSPNIDQMWANLDPSPHNLEYIENMAGFDSGEYTEQICEMPGISRSYY